MSLICSLGIYATNAFRSVISFVSSDSSVNSSDFSVDSSEF
jgi:hypothetical protein